MASLGIRDFEIITFESVCHGLFEENGIQETQGGSSAAKAEIAPICSERPFMNRSFGSVSVRSGLIKKRECLHTSLSTFCLVEDEVFDFLAGQIKRAVSSSRCAAKLRVRIV